MRGLLALPLLLLAFAGCADEAGSSETADEDLGGADEGLVATDDTGIIRGVVVDQTITPVEGATISIQGTETSATSNAAGGFGFDGLDAGTYFLAVEKFGFGSVQQSVEVVAGVATPPVVRILLEAEPSLQPYVAAEHLAGYLACGAPVVVTSLGCTTYGAIADATDSAGIFPREYEVAPFHIQGELVWENTQLLGGQFIWELSPRNCCGGVGQPAWGHRDITPSPALAYMNKTFMDGDSHDRNVAEWVVSDGMNFRVFAGPHEMCEVGTFGCGLTLDQRMDLFLHEFYNFSPPEGWRFTIDGAHEPPE